VDNARALKDMLIRIREGLSWISAAAERLAILYRLTQNGNIRCGAEVTNQYTVGRRESNVQESL